VCVVLTTDEMMIGKGQSVPRVPVFPALVDPCDSVVAKLVYDFARCARHLPLPSACRVAALAHAVCYMRKCCTLTILHGQCVQAFRTVFDQSRVCAGDPFHCTERTQVLRPKIETHRKEGMEQCL